MNTANSFWTRKYRQHIAAMIGLCYRYVPDRATAEDLAHDAFLRAIEKADTLRMTERFEGWLTRITLNTVMDHLRESVRMATVDAEQIAADTPEPDGDITPESMMEAIRQADFSCREIVEAIAQLPEHHRTVLNLYVFERLTHKQIAEKLEISPNTSKSHLMRARKELQIILFNKSKQKNRPLMTFILPLFGVDAAFDRYCRHQVRGFALPPQRPLSASHLTSAPSNLPLRVRYHALRAPVVAGLGTAAVGAMLLPAVIRHPQPVAPMPVSPAPAVVAPAPAADTTVVVEEPEPPAQTVKPKAVKAMLPSENKDTVVSSKDTSGTASSGTVVIRRTVRRNNKTIVIKDTNKR